MRKITTIIACVLCLAVAFSLDAAPKKKVTKKKAKSTNLVKTTPQAPKEIPEDTRATGTTKSIEELIIPAVGKEGAYQQIHQLVKNQDFVERAGIGAMVEKLNGLSGSAYKFNQNGTDFYLLKFSNYLIDPTTEDVILYVPGDDNIIRCRCKNSENMEILNKEKDFEITDAEVQKFYDSTYNMQGY